MRCRLRRFFRNPRSPKLTLKTLFEHFSGNVLNISRNGETHFSKLFRQLLSMVCIDSDWHFTLHRPASNHIASHLAVYLHRNPHVHSYLCISHPSRHASIYLSICLSIYLSMHLSIHFFVARSVLRRFYRLVDCLVDLLADLSTSECKLMLLCTNLFVCSSAPLESFRR